MKTDLKAIIDGNRIKPAIQGNKKRSSNHPSSASVSWEEDGETKVAGACQRAEYYAYTLEDNQINIGAASARMSRILQVGNMYESMFIEEFKASGLYVADQVPFYIDEYNISGRIDLIIRDPYIPWTPVQPHKKGSLIGIDFKTLGGYYGAKGKIFSTKDTPLEAGVENVLQMMIYLYYFKKMDITKWVIFYIDRALGTSEANPDHWNTFVVELDENGHAVISHEEGTYTLDRFSVYDILERYKNLTKAVESKTLPKRDYEIQYSNQKILSLYDKGLLNKKDTETITKIISKKKNRDSLLSKDEPPLLKKGDWKCSYCQFASVCYSNRPEKISAVPLIRPVDVNEPSLEDIEI